MKEWIWCSKKIKPPIGFVGVGVVTVFTNLAVFQIVNRTNAPLVIAIAAGNIASILVNFMGLRKLFSGRDDLSSVFRYAGSFVFYYLLTVFLMLISSELAFDEIHRRALVIVLLTPINYWIQKNIVFRNINS